MTNCLKYISSVMQLSRISLGKYIKMAGCLMDRAVSQSIIKFLQYNR